MGLFSRKNEDRTQEILDCLSAYVRQYYSNHPSSEVRIGWAVSETEERISTMSGMEMRKLVKSAGPSAEHCALDALMDRIMYWIQHSSSENGAKDESKALLAMWNDINDCLLRKGYISQEKHDEKRRTGELLSQIRSPF